jgi:hypothetical protein
MTKKREEFINSHLGAFNFALLQDLNTLLMHLKVGKIKKREFRQYMSRSISERGANLKPEQIAVVERITGAPRCPKCNANLLMYDVNSKPCNQVGGEYKTQIMCSGMMACNFERFSKKSIQEIYNELSAGPHKAKCSGKNNN